MNQQRRIESELIRNAHESFYGRAYGRRASLLFKSKYDSKVQDKILSDDPRMERFAFEFAEAIERAYSIAKIGPSGLLSPTNDSYYPGDIGKILFVSGFSMEPGGVPPYNDDLHVSPEILDCITEVSEVCFENWIPASVKLNKISSSGLPLMTKNLLLKREIQYTSKSQFQSIINAFNDRDVNAIRSLYWNHHIAMAYTLGGRSSVQSVKLKDGKYTTKEREVTTFDGSKVKANFHLDFSNRFAMRKRVVYGLSGSVNYPLQFLASGLREYMATRYAFTFKHRGPTFIEEKARKFKYFIPLDFVAFDTSFASSIFKKMADAMPFKDDVKEFIAGVPHMPILVRSDWSADVSKEVSMMWRGNVEKPWEIPNHVGNPSGWAFVDIAAKIVAVSVVWSIMKKHTRSTLSQILEGSGEWGLLNMGDDCLIMLNDEEQFNELIGLFDGTSGDQSLLTPFKIEIERPGAFTGWHLAQDKPSDNLKVIRRFTSFFESRYARERGIDHSSMQYPALGFNASRDLHFTHPNGITSYQISDKIFKQNFGYTQGDIVGQSEIVKGLDAVSLADYEVLNDPSKLQWKFSDSDVSKVLINTFYHVTPPEEVASWVQQFLI